MSVEQKPSPRISQGQWLVAALVLALFSVLSFIGYRWAMVSPLATLTEFSGAPDRDESESQRKWFEAELGDQFSDGDGARTPTESTAKFRLNNGALLTLKPASIVRFRVRGGKSGPLQLSVEVGEADVRTNAGTLILDSQFGDIVIDKNSLVTLRREGARMVLAVELGKIEWGGSKGAKKRSIQAGEELQLEIGGVVIEEEPGEEKSLEGAKEENPEQEAEEEIEIERGDGVASPDVVATAGDSFVIHDPTPPTKVGLDFSSLCDGPARMSVKGQRTEAEATAALGLARGRHAYEIRCLKDPDTIVAKGVIRILRDGGTRKLPQFAPSASIVTDGRRYTVMYQQKLPRVTVSWPTAPQASSYSLRVGGRVIKTKAPHYVFSSGALRRGKHSLVFSAASSPPRQSRTTVVSVVYDTQAPAARVSTLGGFAPGSEVKVRGQALPGWSVSVEGKELQMDKQRRFSGEYAGEGTLPIAFSHPTHGIHYYLRRPRSISAP